MNPFLIKSESDKELFNILAKINKKSAVTKEKSLKQLLNNIKRFDIENNITEIVNTVLPCLLNESLEVTTPSFMIINSLYTVYGNIMELDRIIPTIIIFSLNHPEFHKDKTIVNPANILKYQNQLLESINFEHNRIVFYKIIILLLRYTKEKHVVELSIHTKLNQIKIDNEVDFKFIYNIFKFLSTEENKTLMAEKVKSVRKINLIDLKWDLLLEFTNFLHTVAEEEIQRDSRYLSVQNISRIITDRNLNFDLVNSRSPECLEIILQRVKEKKAYIIQYINEQSPGSKNLEFNVLEFLHDFSILNECCDFTRINQVVNYIENKKLWDSYDKTKTLLGLEDRQKLVRAFIIKVQIDLDIEPESLEDLFPYSLEVLPISYFKNYFDRFTGHQEAIIRKFPSLLTMDYLKSIIVNRSKLLMVIDLIHNDDMKEYIVSVLKHKYRVNDFIFIYEAIEIPYYLHHIFYFNLYKHKDLKNIKIDSRLVFNTYLNKDFILHLVEREELDLEVFLEEITNSISKVKVNNSMFYSSAYFYSNPRFFENIEKVPFDTKTCMYLEFILSLLQVIHTKTRYSNKVYYLICLLSEILGNSEIDSQSIHFTEELLSSIKHCQNEFTFKIIFDQLNSGVLNINRVREIENTLGVDKSFIFPDSDDYSFYIDMASRIFKGENLPINDLEVGFDSQNKRIINLLVEYFHTFEESANVSFSQDSTNDSHYRIAFTIEDTNYLSNRALLNITSADLNNGANNEKLLNLIENDFIWELPNKLFQGREQIFNTFLENTYRILSNDFCNIYNLARFGENLIESELFDMITANIDFVHKVEGDRIIFIWNVFLRSIEYIRNINTIFFIEKNIRNLNYKKFLSSTHDEGLIQSFGYNFPNLLSNKVNIEKYIEKESKIRISGIDAVLLKKGSGFILKMHYGFEDTKFECSIEIDSCDISKTSFTCNHFHKDLITLKIKGLLKKSRRYMEIMSLWKVNIDRKMEGVKECFICYLVVDASDNSFPDFACNQCGNKFHKRCISQWGAKSGNMTCPLCRKSFK